MWYAGWERGAKATELRACVAGCSRDPRRAFSSVLCRGLAAWAPVDAGEAEPLRRQRADCRVAMKAPGSRLRELEEAYEGWRFLIGQFLEEVTALAFGNRPRIVLIDHAITANTRKQWPTYLTSGSCTSRHSTFALVPTLTLLTFVPFGVARRRVEAPRHSAITAARALRRMDGSRAERHDVPRAGGLRRRERPPLVPELAPGHAREQ